MSIRFLASVVLLALLPACAGAGHQKLPLPDERAAVPADRCRVYVAREDGSEGSLRHVSVLDGQTEVGALAQDEYLCWDRPPERGLGTLVFEGLAPAMQGVENVFDLPRQAGTTSWFVIEIAHAGRQPQIRSLGAEAGRALIARRKPAKK